MVVSLVIENLEGPSVNPDKMVRLMKTVGSVPLAAVRILASSLLKSGTKE